MMRSRLLALIFCSWLSAGFAQSGRVDSLRRNVLAARGDGPVLAAIFSLCDERSSLSPDTLYRYALWAQALALKSQNPNDGFLADYYVANALALKGRLDTAMQLLNRHYEAVQKLAPDAKLRNYYAFFKGQLLMKAGRQKEALEIYYAALARAEGANDAFYQLVSRTCIGWAYMELNQNRNAIDWFHKAINGVQNPALFEKYNLTFSNLAAVYNTIGKNDSAEYFIKQSLNYARRQQSLQGIANALAIEVGIFLDTKRPAEAERAMSEAIAIRRQIGDPFYVVSDMTQLALFYAANGQPQKGIALCEEGLAMAARYGLPSKLPILYEALAANYKTAGQYERYGETLRQLLTVKDSAYKTASADALAQLQARYDVQKQENIIMQQRFDLERKNYWLYAAALFSALIFGAAFLLLNAYRRKQKLKLALMQQEEKRRAETAVHDAEEAERKRIAADLHDSLGAYAASIANNIERLQAGATADKPVLQDLSGNAQAIVSQLSDTIWVLKKDAQSLTAISDRVKTFIHRLAPNYPGVTIDVREEIKTDCLLPPAQAFHLFQIIKEAVVNALRHSGCRQIAVGIESCDDWRITISDDGNGLVSNRNTEGGNGLPNMKARAEESGWKIAWQPNEPQGTRVVIEAS